MKTFVVVCLLCLISSCSSHEEEINIFAASSMTDVVKKISKTFGLSSGCKDFNFNFAGSYTLARQIKYGGKADIFISADLQAVELLGKKISGHKRIAGNRLVVIANKSSSIRISSLDDLLFLKRIAIGNTETVPAGIYAKEALEEAKIWERIKNRIIPANHVRAVLAYVENNIVDVGIVYKTDALISDKVKIVYDLDYDKIGYFAVLLSENICSRRFFRFLGSESSKKIFADFGFSR